jgi:hypothetical protein
MKLINQSDLIKIEELERKVLMKFSVLFRESLDEFSTSIDRSLYYLDKIIFPTIMASKQDKSYNPFAEIIEKYAVHILTIKLEKQDYKLLPLSYSADLTLEHDDYILNIDVKTANLANPSDFKETINVGINQTTQVGKLSINRNFLPYPFYVYPATPPYYKLTDGQIKLILTYGFMFIYPSYNDLIREIRKEYQELFVFFKKKVKKVLIPILSDILKTGDKNKINRILNSKPEASRYTRGELITESIIRGIFIYEEERNKLMESLKLDQESNKVIKKFFKNMKEFTNNLRERDIKPIAIIVIAIPNGLLREKYVDKFVSGKNYSKSMRYHYQDGIFEVIKEKTGREYPRVLFLDINKRYLDELRSYFKKIIIFDYQLKELKNEG